MTGRWHILMVLFLTTLVAGWQTQSNPSGSAAQNGGGNSSKAKSKPTPRTTPTPTPSKEPPVLVIRSIETLPAPSEAAGSPPFTGTLAAPDAEEIIKLLGNTGPFTLKAKSSNVIVIYSIKPKATEPKAKDEESLRTLRENILTLRNIRQRVVEIFVPHSSLLGKVADKAKDLHYKNMTFEAVGSDKIRITRDADVSDESFRAILRDVQHL